MATTTAAQRREHERAAYNAYVAECPSRQVLDALSDKWVTLVLTALADAPRRYSELSRTIAGVSQKMLTQTLRMLERDGLVTRTITASVRSGWTTSSAPSAGPCCRSSARSRTGQKRTSARSTPPASPTITPRRLPSRSVAEQASSRPARRG
jgi:Predicted transcriptional regulators